MSTRDLSRNDSMTSPTPNAAHSPSPSPSPSPSLSPSSPSSPPPSSSHDTMVNCVLEMVSNASHDVCADLKAILHVLTSSSEVSNPMTQLMQQSKQPQPSLASRIALLYIASCIDTMLEETQRIQLIDALRDRLRVLLNSCLGLERSGMRGITTSSVFESHLYVFQTALHRRYPLGAASMSRPAVFYLCEQSKHLLPHLERLCWTLMSRRSSFRMLPLREQHETDAAADEQQLQSSSCIDLEELSVFIEQDRDNGALPLLVVASVDTTSSPLLRLDDISALRELADQHGLWLHVEGNALDLWLCSSPSDSAPTIARVVLEVADSVLVRPMEWFGYDIAETSLLLLRDTSVAGDSNDAANDPGDAHIRHENHGPLTEPIAKTSDLLSMLCMFLYVDSASTRNRASVYLQMCRRLIEMASTRDTFELVLGPNPELAPHRLVFKIRPRLDSSSLNLRDETVNSLLLHRVEKRLTDTLNWRIKAVQSKGQRYVVVDPPKLCVPSQAQDMNYLATSADVEELMDEISFHIEAMEKALQMRPLLAAKIRETPHFEWVPISRFADKVGVGGFRLIPAFVAKSQSEDSEEEVSNALNSLNDSLARALFNTDAMFRGLFDEDGKMCVAILSAPLSCLRPTVEEMAEATHKLIVGIQVKMDFPSEVVNLMSNALQMGIHEAEQRVRDMQDGQYHPVSLIRNLPLVGSVIGWFVPPGGEEKPRGQSFDLESRSFSERAFQVERLQNASAATIEEELNEKTHEDDEDVAPIAESH